MTSFAEKYGFAQPQYPDAQQATEIPQAVAIESGFHGAQAQPNVQYTRVDLPAIETKRVTNNMSQSVKLTYGGRICASVSIWILLGILFYGISTIDAAANGPLFAVIIPVPFLCMCCILYLCLVSNADEFRSHSWVDESEAENLIKKSFGTKPVLNQHMECYHRQRSGSHDRTVVTWRGDRPKQFDDSIDLSPDVDFTQSNQRKAPVMRFHIAQEYMVASQEVAQNFQRQMTEFIDENRHRDRQYKTSEAYAVPDLPKLLMIKRGHRAKPWMFNTALYYFCVLISCAVPWSWLVNTCYTDSKYYTSKKILSLTPFDPDMKRDAENRRKDT